MTVPLERYGLIGDGETAALISDQGSVDWLCLPRFDSAACCCALVGTREHGHWTIAPEEALTRSQQRYQSDAVVLETDLTTCDGTIRLIDFMPTRSKNPVLIRIVEGLSGRVRVLSNVALRFDYGNMSPWITVEQGDAVMRVGPDEVILRGSERFEIVDNKVSSRFVAMKGSRHFFLLTYGTQDAAKSPTIKPEIALAETQAYWREWIGRFCYSGQYGDAMRRSLLTLKALIHRPTGGLVSAPTTSLPERPGGRMNWDYRYCWLRDAAFAVSAFVDCGYLEEASAWRNWIMRAAAGEPDKLKIMYRVDGSRRLDEVELPWLPGYRFASPVRVGNSAAGQRQLDVFGELLRALHTAQRAGMARTEQGRHLELAIVRHVEKVWQLPDHGIWEVRGEPRHYTYSKVMAWVALDRFLDGHEGGDIDQGERLRMQDLRDRVHKVICREGFNSGLGSFTSYFGGEEIDASLLLLPKFGFLPADDPRIAGTVKRIENELVTNGLVHRHIANGVVQEGTFLACSFWLAECQLAQMRRSDAIATIEAALAVASPLGLLSEEYNLGGQNLSGNFPQALSHLALIHALLALKKFDLA